MKISFSWKKDVDSIYPVCSSITENNDGKSILSSLLMDDGGLPYNDTIAWVDEGIKRINSVLTSEFAVLDWDRERWGAEFTIENAQVYALLDDSYFQILTTQQLKKALLEWKLFLESTPNLQNIIEVDL
ncbi:hypothetical protein [Pseudoalteromonas sp. 1_2015MBL_MicDiv]|uniref:hypothetical protein n=1 Tax=Pseudoalteromonas sp. 1_2015MBL_MicDiv TaxID=1720343 RepID=UPI000BBEED4D|nr:hypothetical protein [Pseudoalteromonas sp. 1_2015MBL_MicDiv]ATG79570.1 hypothetical protein AOR04_18635 [Pseudoalteromonas sp. 1_2015MBL_MicDiv]